MGQRKRRHTHTRKCKHRKLTTRKKHNCRHKHHTHRHRNGKCMKQKGGVLSNFLVQDITNFGRNMMYNASSEYNTLAGYKSPVNPTPWKDQLH